MVGRHRHCWDEEKGVAGALLVVDEFDVLFAFGLLNSNAIPAFGVRDRVWVAECEEELLIAPGTKIEQQGQRSSDYT